MDLEYSAQEITKSDIIAAEVKPRELPSSQSSDPRQSAVSTPGPGVDGTGGEGEATLGGDVQSRDGEIDPSSEVNDFSR